MRVIQNIGMASIEPINYNGMEIVPLQFLKAVLPNPQDLGENYGDFLLDTVEAAKGQFTGNEKRSFCNEQRALRRSVICYAGSKRFHLS